MVKIEIRIFLLFFNLIAFSTFGQLTTNGLIVNYDSKDKSSYTGIGTTFYDLSGNSNHGTIGENARIIDNEGGGVMSYDGNFFLFSKTAVSSGTNNYNHFKKIVLFTKNELIQKVHFKS